MNFTDTCHLSPQIRDVPMTDTAFLCKAVPALLPPGTLSTVQAHNLYSRRRCLPPCRRLRLRVCIVPTATSPRRASRHRTHTTLPPASSQTPTPPFVRSDAVTARWASGLSSTKPIAGGEVGSRRHLSLPPCGRSVPWRGFIGCRDEKQRQMM